MKPILENLIIKCIYFSGPQTIAEISQTLGKSVPIITKSILKLIDINVIYTEGLRASTGGRRAAVYNLEKDRIGNILAISISRYSIIFSLYNILNNPIYENNIANFNHLDDWEIYNLIVNECKNIIDNHSQHPIFAIGITAPGFVDFEHAVNNSYNYESPLYDLASRLNQIFNIETYIENDSSAIAIAENYFGQAKDKSHALVINLTWGVGLGIIINKELFKGHNGFAGEFSHIPLADESKLCSCGKKGCIEVEASLESALDFIQKRLNQNEPSLLTIEDTKENKFSFFKKLVQAYCNGDQLSIYAIKQIAYMLGKGIATLIHILNPESVIISGIGAVFGKDLLNEIQSSIQIYCIPRLANRTNIEISQLSTTAQALATACVAVIQSKNLLINIKQNHSLKL